MLLAPSKVIKPYPWGTHLLVAKDNKACSKLILCGFPQCLDGSKPFKTSEILIFWGITIHSPAILGYHFFSILQLMGLFARAGMHCAGSGFWGTYHLNTQTCGWLWTYESPNPILGESTAINPIAIWQNGNAWHQMIGIRTQYLKPRFNKNIKNIQCTEKNNGGLARRFIVWGNDPAPGGLPNSKGWEAWQPRNALGLCQGWRSLGEMDWFRGKSESETFLIFPWNMGLFGWNVPKKTIHWWEMRMELWGVTLGYWDQMTSNDFNLGLEGYQADHKTYTKTLKTSQNHVFRCTQFKHLQTTKGMCHGQKVVKSWIVYPFTQSFDGNGTQSIFSWGFRLTHYIYMKSSMNSECGYIRQIREIHHYV